MKSIDFKTWFLSPEAQALGHSNGWRGIAEGAWQAALSSVKQGAIVGYRIASVKTGNTMGYFKTHADAKDLMDVYYQHPADHYVIEPMFGPALTQQGVQIREPWQHDRNCEYVVSDGPAPCTCSASKHWLPTAHVADEKGGNHG